MQNYYLEFDLNDAEVQIQNYGEELAKVARSISSKAAPLLSGDRRYLDQKLIVEDFDSSLDEAVTDFLEACIPSFHLWVDIQHGLDGKAKIILA